MQPKRAVGVTIYCIVTPHLFQALGLGVFLRKTQKARTVTGSGFFFEKTFSYCTITVYMLPVVLFHGPRLTVPALKRLR